MIRIWQTEFFPNTTPMHPCPLAILACRTLQDAKSPFELPHLIFLHRYQTFPLVGHIFFLLLQDLPSLDDYHLLRCNLVQIAVFRSQPIVNRWMVGEFCVEERHFWFVVDDASGFGKRSGFVSRLRRHFGLVEIATVGVGFGKMWFRMPVRSRSEGFGLVRRWLNSFFGWGIEESWRGLRDWEVWSGLERWLEAEDGGIYKSSITKERLWQGGGALIEEMEELLWRTKTTMDGFWKIHLYALSQQVFNCPFTFLFMALFCQDDIKAVIDCSLIERCSGTKRKQKQTIKRGLLFPPHCRSELMCVCVSRLHPLSCGLTSGNSFVPHSDKLWNLQDTTAAQNLSGSRRESGALQPFDRISRKQVGVDPFAMVFWKRVWVVWKIPRIDCTCSWTWSTNTHTHWGGDLVLPCRTNMFGSDVVYYWLTHGQGNAYLNQSLTDLKIESVREGETSRSTRNDLGVTKISKNKMPSCVQDASPSSATDDCTMIFSFFLFLFNAQCIVWLSFSQTRWKIPQKIFCKRNRRTRTGAKTRDKEHRHFFSWTLPSGLSKVSNFWVICTQPPNVYCCRVAAVWSTFYEMQHEKSFTLAALHTCLFQNTEVYGGFLGGYLSYLSNLETENWSHSVANNYTTN